MWPHKETLLLYFWLPEGGIHLIMSIKRHAKRITKMEKEPYVQKSNLVPSLKNAVQEGTKIV